VRDAVAVTRAEFGIEAELAELGADSSLRTRAAGLDRAIEPCGHGAVVSSSSLCD
jgi:hypothetical protein